MSEKPLISQDFKSGRNPSIIYSAAIFKDSEHCNCKGFEYRRTCKHIRQLRRTIAATNSY